jgi:ADP-ribose pyrophosphatase YjhB (NUDIX family)
MDRIEEFEFDRAIQVIDRIVLDSRQGLPESLFLLVSRCTPLVNVDLLIKNDQGETLLTWRHDQFYGPGWHIAGGIVRFKETMIERVAKVARQEIGCDAVVIGDCLQVTEIQHPDRHVRGHFISHLFKCELEGSPDASRRAVLEAPKHGQWAWFSDPPENLIPQHRRFASFIGRNSQVNNRLR